MPELLGRLNHGSSLLQVNMMSVAGARQAARAATHVLMSRIERAWGLVERENRRKKHSQ